MVFTKPAKLLPAILVKLRAKFFSIFLTRKDSVKVRAWLNAQISLVYSGLYTA